MNVKRYSTISSGGMRPHLRCLPIAEGTHPVGGLPNTNPPGWAYLVVKSVFDLILPAVSKATIFAGGSSIGMDHTLSIVWHGALESR